MTRYISCVCYTVTQWTARILSIYNKVGRALKYIGKGKGRTLIHASSYPLVTFPFSFFFLSHLPFSLLHSLYLNVRLVIVVIWRVLKYIGKVKESHLYLLLSTSSSSLLFFIHLSHSHAFLFPPLSTLIHICSLKLHNISYISDYTIRYSDYSVQRILRI